MNADVNLFGPGNRPNATIGRAVRLILRNVFQMLPGISDKSTQGNPGKYSLCIAERMRGKPWARSAGAGLSGGHLERHRLCRRRLLVENHGGNTPEQVLGSVADAMANYGCITLGQSVVILAPEHMQIVADAGWTRRRVQDFLFTEAKRSVEGMKGVSKFRDREYDTSTAMAPMRSPSKGSCIAALAPTTSWSPWAATPAAIRAFFRRGAAAAVRSCSTPPSARSPGSKKEDRSMQLYAPTSTTATRKPHARTGARQAGRRAIGILENGKLNAEEMLNEVAQLFVQRPAARSSSWPPRRTPAPRLPPTRSPRWRPRSTS